MKCPHLQTEARKGFVCVLTGGPDRVIAVDGKDYLFEDHPRLGPCPITKSGRERRLGPRHSFWRAVTQWYEQGREIENGKCKWSEPPDPLANAVHLGGRHWLIKNAQLSS